MTERNIMPTEKGKKRLQRNMEICSEYKRLSSEYKGSSINRICTYIAKAYDLTSMQVRNIVMAGGLI